MCGRCPGAGARRDGLSPPGSCRPATDWRSTCRSGCCRSAAPASATPTRSPNGRRRSWARARRTSGFGNPDTLAQWSQEVLGKGPTNLSGAMFYLFLLATLGVISSAANALGEEIGWRGFLVWEMRKVLPSWAVGLGSGLIWSVWHYPGILFANYNAGTGSHVLQLALFTASVASIGVVFAVS